MRRRRRETQPPSTCTPPQCARTLVRLEDPLLLRCLVIALFGDETRDLLGRDPIGLLGAVAEERRRDAQLSAHYSSERACLTSLSKLLVPFTAPCQRMQREGSEGGVARRRAPPPSK